MQIRKEVRQLAREMLRASFTDGQLDHGKVSALVNSLLERKPRHYLNTLEFYKRLLRLELEKRHARIESAAELAPDVVAEVKQNLQRQYGNDLTTEFVVNPDLLGGMRVQVGNDVWDSSVRNRLVRLEEQMS